MNYIEYGKILYKNHFLSPIYLKVIDLVHDEIKEKEHNDEILKLFLVYFSLVCDGNTCMSLDATALKDKWQTKCKEMEVSLASSSNYDEEELKVVLNEFNNALGYLSLINEKDLPNMIGNDKYFIIEDNFLYAKKYYKAVKGLSESIKRLFKKDKFPDLQEIIDYRSLVEGSFKLTNGQEKAVVEGYNKNLIITGGPGTGKTTSIFFLLFNFIYNNPDVNIYMTAPSGKAASRMKESILKTEDDLNKAAKEKYKAVIAKFESLEGYTIHRLLDNDFNTNVFRHNETNKFEDDSIFVVDEASMCDVCIFDALLKAIPDNARVFLLGDENQLPSVENGAVLSNLLNIDFMKDYIVELDESIRFNKESEIYKLAEAINTGSTLPVEVDDWLFYKDFTIKEVEDKKFPVYYFKDSLEKTKDETIVKDVIKKWGKHFYKDIARLSSEIDPNDLDKLDKLYDLSNKAKILTGENEGPRGKQTINKIIIDEFIKQDKNSNELCPGEIIMITKNKKDLNLYNGETGLFVKFKNDETLYFMIEKSDETIKEDGKKENAIFKIGAYLFYPIRLLSRNEIDYAFAMTIHKSQGSDYKQILVILPRLQGHPLSNRQIVYTAITRTKGNTYILSNQERLEECRDKIIIRDTNIK